MKTNNYIENVKTFYIDQKTLELLDNFANNFSISRSAVVRILINKYCKNKTGSYSDIQKRVDFLTDNGGL